MPQTAIALPEPPKRVHHYYERGPRGRPWTAEDEALLRSTWLTARHSNDVVRVLRRPYSELQFKTRELGMPDRPKAWTGRIAARCMCCRTPFMAEHRFNRLCILCKAAG
ncbi:MAG: hypothetical protein EON48_01075 [Acetobacteraceae bacterium]|nr:MAG: hypothetical protein EON48_01075 [Acetobacteraceae bacterium]